MPEVDFLSTLNPQLATTSDSYGSRKPEIEALKEALTTK